MIFSISVYSPPSPTLPSLCRFSTSIFWPNKSNMLLYDTTSHVPKKIMIWIKLFQIRYVGPYCINDDFNRVLGAHKKLVDIFPKILPFLIRPMLLWKCKCCIICANKNIVLIYTKLKWIYLWLGKQWHEVKMGCI